MGRCLARVCNGYVACCQMAAWLSIIDAVLAVMSSSGVAALSRQFQSVAAG